MPGGPGRGPEPGDAAAKFPFHGRGEMPVAVSVAQDVTEVARVERGERRARELRDRARDQELSHG